MTLRLSDEVQSSSSFDNFDRRLAIAFGAVILVLMVVVLLAGNYFLRGVMNREEEKLASLLTSVLAESVNRVGFSGKYQARLLMEELQSTHPELRYLLITDLDGRIVAHSNPVYNGKMLAPDALSVTRKAQQDQTTVSRTLLFEGEPVREVTMVYRGGFDNAAKGVIQVGVSQRERQDALHRGLYLIAFLVLLLTTAGILLTRQLSTRFARPIKQLSNEMAATLQAIPDLLFELDRGGRYLQVMAHREELLAAPKEQLLGHTIHEILPPEAAATVQAALDEADIRGEVHGRQILLSRPQGPRWFEISVAKKPDATGQGASFIVLSRDITERQLAHTQRLLAENVFESSREGILVADPDHRIVRVNPAFCNLTGYTPGELLGQTTELLHSERLDSAFYDAMWQDIERIGHWQGELWNRTKDGESTPILASISAIRNDAGQVIHYVSIETDITKLKESEARLEYMARHDSLTGLANRLMLHIRLEHALNRARREEKSLALLMLDLDRFKDINDSFGHAIGDVLLKEVAIRLTQRVRGIDTVCRLGGDEFTILLEDLEHPDDAARLAQDIVDLVAQSYLLPNSNEVSIGASIGIALFPAHGATEEELLQHVDAALYQAKAEGRGRYQFFTNDLTLAARQRIALETRLRRAIPNNELRLHYQPQIETASGRIVGAEALVRWQDPLGGLTMPSDFIALAEQSNLIVALGDWVLNEACRQGRHWIDAGLPPLIIAVNVSSRQFQHGDLADKVASVLKQTGFPAHQLELELTESVLMKHQERAMAVLEQLRGLGVRIAVDDFGTGYSSLAYLKAFPLDTLKIDKSFVHDIPMHQDDMEIAATIIAMAHTLALDVLAEGVETPAQLEFLQKQGCDFYQGYLASRPVPADEFERYVRRLMVTT